MTLAETDLASALPVALIILMAILFGVANIVLSHVIGPRRQGKTKGQTYESGMNPIGTARKRFNVRFYLIAMVFLVFDVEIIFLYPWAVIYKQLRMFAFLEMLLFVVLILAGFFFIWKKGVLDWAEGERVTPPSNLRGMLEEVPAIPAGR